MLSRRDAERQPGPRKITFLVGPTMQDAPEPSLERAFRHRPLPSQIDDACNSAHDGFPLSSDLPAEQSGFASIVRN